MTPQYSSIKIALFFTNNMSLKEWDDLGIFDREVSLYERQIELGLTVKFITYGNSFDITYQDRLPEIELLCNKWNFPNYLYKKSLPYLHRRALKLCDLIKTNQMEGSDIALRSAIKWGKPLIARMGYFWSEFSENQKRSRRYVKKVLNIEERVFQFSHRIVVTTNRMKKSIADRFPEYETKIVVIPNYVETKLFSPAFDDKKQFDVIFVGRLTYQKNVSALLTALTELDVKSLIVGNGELRDELQTQYGDANGKIRWEGNVSNSGLPSLMNRSRLFVLPSHYEGHPKSLIEAMSCGMPVIGADSPGIREIIHHGVNGFLCGTDSESIRRFIQELLDNRGLSKSLGKNARQYVLDHFSLDRVLKMEYRLYREVINDYASQVFN